MPRHQSSPSGRSTRDRCYSSWPCCCAAGSGLAAQTSSGVLTGFVTDGAGSPAPRTIVAASGDGGSVQETRTDDDGRFRLSLAPGPYRLEIATRSGASRKTATVVLLAGETVRIDIVVPPGDGVMGPEAIRRQAPGVAFVLAPPPLAALPLDRADPSAAILALAPGVARGTAFGAAAGIGTPRRLDGLDLGDPLDGSAWTSFVLPSATSAAVRAGVGADERDGSGAVLDIVTRAGGASLRGIVDVGRRRQRLEPRGAVRRDAERESAPRRSRSARPQRAGRDGAERTAHAASRLRSRRRVWRRDAHRRAGRRHQDTARARAVVWGSNGRTANVVGFVDRRSTTKDVPFALRADAAAGPREPAHLEHHRLARVVAEPAGRRNAAVGVDRGPARHALDAADERPAGPRG